MSSKTDSTSATEDKGSSMGWIGALAGAGIGLLITMFMGMSGGMGLLLPLLIAGMGFLGGPLIAQALDSSGKSDGGSIIPNTIIPSAAGNTRGPAQGNAPAKNNGEQIADGIRSGTNAVVDTTVSTLQGNPADDPNNFAPIGDNRAGLAFATGAVIEGTGLATSRVVTGKFVSPSLNLIKGADWTAKKLTDGETRIIPLRWQSAEDRAVRAYDAYQAYKGNAADFAAGRPPTEEQLKIFDKLGEDGLKQLAKGHSGKIGTNFDTDKGVKTAEKIKELNDARRNARFSPMERMTPESWHKIPKPKDGNFRTAIETQVKAITTDPKKVEHLTDTFVHFGREGAPVEDEAILKVLMGPKTQEVTEKLMDVAAKYDPNIPRAPQDAHLSNELRNALPENVIKANKNPLLKKANDFTEAVVEKAVGTAEKGVDIAKNAPLPDAVKKVVDKADEAVEAAKAAIQADRVAATKAAGKAGGKLVLGLGTAIGAGTEGYQAWSEGKDASTVVGATAVGGAKGAFDTVLPGMRDGYSDVIGNKKLTYWDRTLNGLDHTSGTAAGVGAVASLTVVGAEVGVPTMVIGGVTNLAVNGVKGVTKITGFAGEDQGGGYIYDLGKLGIESIGSMASSAYHGIFGGGTDVAAPSAPNATPKKPDAGKKPNKPQNAH